MSCIFKFQSKYLENTFYTGVHLFSNMQILHLHSAGITFKFKMKVLAVCLMAAALVGMSASTPLKKVKGIVKSPISISVKGVGVLKEGPGK